MSTPTVNVNLAMCSCTYADHRATSTHHPSCNGRPILIPCPIPRCTPDRVKQQVKEWEATQEELENVRPFEALHADLSEQIRAAWEATGVAGTVKGMTTLADVVGVTKASLREADAENETLRAKLDGATQNEAKALEQGGRDQETMDALRARVTELEAFAATAHGQEAWETMKMAHAKALLRARNEGRERAARLVRNMAPEHWSGDNMTSITMRRIYQELADGIDATKEPE